MERTQQIQYHPRRTFEFGRDKGTGEPRPFISMNPTNMIDGEDIWCR